MRTFIVRRFVAVCSLILAATASPLVAEAQDTLIVSPVPAGAEAAADAKPIAVVAIASFDKWLEDVDFIGGLMGNPQASQMVTAHINQVTNNQGLPSIGVDGSRAFGIVVQPGAMSPAFALCLPVTDQAAFLAHLQQNQVATSQDMGNGVQQVKLGPMGWDVYAKNAGGWTMLSMAPALMEGIPADPGPLFTALTAEYDFAVQFNVQSLPEPMRQMALDQISAAAKRGSAKRAGESDADFQARQGELEKQLADGQRMFQEFDQFTLGLALDGAQQRAYFDMTYTALPGTSLAEEFAATAQATTNFAGFIQPEAAASFCLAGKSSPSSLSSIDWMINGLRGAIAEGVTKEIKGPSAETVNEAFTLFIDAITETIAAGAVDGGGTLTATPNAMTLVAGGLVTDPAKIEAGLKKLSDAAAADPESGLPTVQMAAATHGGVTFHTMTLPVGSDMKPLWGDQLEVVVGVGPQAAYLALGRDAMSSLQAAIDASAAAPGKAIPPMELTVSLGQILTAMQSVTDGPKGQLIDMLAGMLAGGAPGGDQIHAIAEPVPNGLRTRLEVKGGVLQAVGMAALMGQMQAAAPGPAPPVVVPQ